MKNVFWALCFGAALHMPSQVNAQDALALDMKARIEQRFPHLKVEPDGNDRLLVKQDGKTVAVPQLGNLRDICSSDATACETQKNIRLQMLADMLNPKHELPGSASVRSVVRPVSYKRAVEQQLAKFKENKTGLDAAAVDDAVPLMEPLGSHFVRMWVRDTPTGMFPISKAQLKELRTTVSELDRISSDNLQMEKIASLMVSKVHPAIYNSSGNDYVSSVLIDAALWKRVAKGLSGEEVSVCFPARIALVAYFPQFDTEKRVDFAALCRALSEQAAPQFSDHVVRRVGDNWLID